MKIVTGIGSREVPDFYKKMIEEIAAYIADKGYLLRSGGAPGSDTFFQKVYEEKKGKMEIYIPWNGFENLWKNNKNIFLADHSICEEYTMKYHPNPDILSQGAFKLMNRNAHQVLGKDLKSPSDIIICYTKDAKVKGGTSQAIRIAADEGIPILNIGNKKNIKQVLKQIDDILSN